jgi:hypothetical protein
LFELDELDFEAYVVLFDPTFTVVDRETGDTVVTLFVVVYDVRVVESVVGGTTYRGV